MTLLELIQQVYGEFAFGTINAVVSSQDPQVQQMYRLLNRLGGDLCRQHPWQRLDREYIFQTIASTTTITTVIDSYQITMASTSGISTSWGLLADGVQPFAQVVSVDSLTQVTMNMPSIASGTVSGQFAQVQYPLPADYNHSLSNTMWDRTNRWPVNGAKTPQEWQQFKSGIVYAGPRLRFRIQGNQITINPPPADNHSLAYEYISKSFVYNAAGTAQTSFTADDDTCIFDDSLMIAGLKVKFKQAKGLDVGMELAEFTNLLDVCKAQDNSASILSMSPQDTATLISLTNVPDGSWSF